MATVNLEEIRRKYNFKQISVATWRDPRSSTIPARGGPSAPMYSAEAISKPYIPTYKVKYKLPEPTDDEASEDEQAAPAPKGEIEEPAADAPVDSPLEPPMPQVDVVEDPAPPPPPEIDPPGTVEDAPPIAADDGEDTQDANPAGESIHIPELLADPLATLEGPLAALPDVAPLEDIDENSLSATPENTLSVDDVQDDLQLSEHIEAPWPPSPPPIDTYPDISEHVDFLDLAEPYPIPALHPVDLVIIDPAQGMPGAFDAPTFDTGPVPGSPDKSVHFAPGTPDPKPTVRKKKSTKGTKSKSKKRVEVQIASLPDDILAIVDGDIQDNLIPVPETPMIVPALVDSDEHPVEEALTDIDAVEATPVIDAGKEPESAAMVPVVDEAPAADPPAVQTEEVTSSKKKDSARSSSRNKDKAKKKNSKSKAAKDRVPVAAAGLGIELALPSDPPAVLDLDDILNNLPPPPPPPPPGAEAAVEGPAVEEFAEVPSEAETNVAASFAADEIPNADSAVDKDMPVQHIPADDADILGASQEDAASLNGQEPDICAPAPTSEPDDIVGLEQEVGPAASVEDGEQHDVEDVQPPGETEKDVGQTVGPADMSAEIYSSHSEELHEAVDCTTVEIGDVAGVPVVVDDEIAAAWDDREEAEDELDLAESGLVDDHADEDDSPSGATTDELEGLHEPAVDSVEDAASEVEIEDIEDLQARSPESAVADVVEQTGDNEEPLISPDIVEEIGVNDEQLPDVTIGTADNAADTQPAVTAIDTPAALEADRLGSPAEAGWDDPSGDDISIGDGLSEVEVVVDDDNAPDQPEINTTCEHIDEGGAGDVLDETDPEPPVSLPVLNEGQDTKVEVQGVTEESAGQEDSFQADEPVADQIVAAESQVEAITDGENEMTQLLDIEQREDAEADNEPPPAEVLDAGSDAAAKEVPAAAEAIPEPAIEDKKPGKVDAPPAAPPSPSLSKSSSHKQRADYWARRPAKRPSTADSKASKSEKPGSSKRSSKSSGDASQGKNREKSSRSSRRYSISAEEEEERRKRRAARKAEEAVRETARIQEVERQKAYEEELRLIRHEARRAARKAAAEETAKLIREEAEDIAREEAEARRRRREAREQEAKTSRSKLVSLHKAGVVKLAPEARGKRIIQHQDERPLLQDIERSQSWTILLSQNQLKQDHRARTAVARGVADTSRKQTVPAPVAAIVNGTVKGLQRPRNHETS
ncbi:hypothetical protein LTR78_001332 [Recurvomyces mirabilis]|uniref:Uncharacterized protein n=1 Tax=Recurvomyces mirabilis TaxID=574656 RepID=A0AAE0WW32_9PEZI|nr:hypothetical protein LTR78_001332 [Recurvomyces mirabilis]KAK5161309.1 hypothetical protein LTS14_001105 [Recurvomyces mirabilis]